MQITSRLTICLVGLTALILTGTFFAGTAMLQGTRNCSVPPVSSGQDSLAVTAFPGQEAAPGAQLAERYGRLPQYFIENKGQLDQQIRYYVRGAGQMMFFTPKGVILGLNQAESGQKKEAKINLEHPGPPHQDGNRHRAAIVRLLPVGMQEGVTLAGLEPQEYKVNYFLGDGPEEMAH